ncbi:MAG: hypothetical protein CMF70_02935 [Magnetovibrio sp.]|nr:hypothetical protein [Magnetovibrio sp.]
MEILPSVNVSSEVVLRDPLEQFLSGQLSENTRRAYKTDLIKFFKFLNLDKITIHDLRRITFQDIVEFRNHLAGEGYKRTSINRKLSSLKALFRMLVAAGQIDQNPADSTLVRGYKIEDGLNGKAIATQALKKIQQAISEEKNKLRQSRDMAIFQLLTFGGLRRSEVSKMRWIDIRVDGVFHVLNLPDTKSGVDQDIKLQAVVMHYLNEYRNNLGDCGYQTEGHIFISLARNRSNGKPLSDQSINLIVKKYALRAGLPLNISAHMFRHTCCTLAIEGGAKPQQVQAHLRHKDLKTTMRYYENREKLTDNASDYINLS